MTGESPGDLEPVSVELLGGFRALVGGRAVPESAWPSRRSAELVQLLALADRRRLTRDQVIDALWPQLSVEAGAANLRKAAHFARQAFGQEDAVVLSGGGVAMFPNRRVEIDVAEFDRAADAALRSGESAACADAASAYRGRLLPDALYEEWTQAERGRLHAQYVELLRQSRQWERLVDIEPTDEPAHRELMRAALDEGNRHAAIRWYGRLRTNLERELGLPPGPASEALYAQCVEGLDKTAAAFVGRQVELARAAVALRDAVKGEVGALVLRGPGGIGKSALARQVAASARAQGWLVVAVHASLVTSPYGPLVAAVEQLLSRDRTLLDVVGEDARATLAELTPLATASHRSAIGLTRHKVIGAVRRLVSACVGVPGVLLVIDDVHLADDATLDACGHLGRAGGGVPLLTVLAYRGDAARPILIGAVAALERAGRCVDVEVGPLDREEVVALVQAGARAKPDEPALRRILQMANGNPFFALELARGVVPDGSLLIEPSVWASVAARFLDLDEATVEMLRTLAVAGDELDPVDASALTGLPEAEAFALLDAALETGTLVVSGARYRFRHEFVRQALLEQVPPHQRIRIHRETASRLESTGADPALIARHWLEGRRPAEAAPWLLAAARHAVGLAAFADAIVALDRLLEHEPEHVEALAIRAEALDALGDRRAPAAYAAAARIAGEPAASDLRAKQGLAEVKQGDPATALRTMEGIEPVTVAGRLAHALAWSGAAVLGFADPATGTAKAAESRRLALETGDSGTLIIASWAQAAAAHARGDLAGSVEADLFETSALPELAINVFDGHLCISQRFLYGSRPYPDVIEFADSLAAEAQRVGAARGHAFAVTLRGEAELLSGRLDEAEEDLRRAARLNRAIGAGVGESLALERRAEVQIYRGNPGEAIALLDEALAVARDTDCGFHLFDRIYGARITAAGDPAAALIAVEEAEAGVRGPLETCPGCRITLVVPAGIAAARGGDLDRAASYLEAAEWLAAVVMRLPGWDAAVEELKGHLALARTGDAPAAAGHFRAAADGFRVTGQALDEARCLALVGA